MILIQILRLHQHEAPTSKVLQKQMEGGSNNFIYRLELKGCSNTQIYSSKWKDAPTPQFYQLQLKGWSNTLHRLRLALAPPCRLELFLGYSLKETPLFSLHHPTTFLNKPPLSLNVLPSIHHNGSHFIYFQIGSTYAQY